MDFDLSDDQREIQNVAAGMLASRAGAAQLRVAAENRRYDDHLWSEICALGWPGIAIAEDFGGAGLSCIEAALIIEEHGYSLAASPLLSTVQAAFIIGAAGSDEQRERWLGELAAGRAKGAVGVVRNGESFVPDAADADVIVLCKEGGASLCLRDEADVDPLETVDPTRRYATVRGAGEPLPGDVAAGRARASIAVAAELVGVCRRSVDVAVAYAKERTQFGRPIGSFQAVSHPCAEMLLATEGARSTVYFAAWSSGADEANLDRAAALAYVSATSAARQVTATAIQIHGGVGFTWEADVQWLFKRAQVASVQMGSVAAARALLVQARTTAMR